MLPNLRTLLGCVTLGSECVNHITYTHYHHFKVYMGKSLIKYYNIHVQLNIIKYETNYNNRVYITNTIHIYIMYDVSTNHNQLIN